MTKKKFFLSLLMCITFNLCMAQKSADDKAYAEKVVEMLKACHLLDNGKEMMTLQFKSVGLNDAQCSVLADEILEIIFRHADEVVVPVYRGHLTYQDLVDLIAFYNSPLGKKVTDPNFMKTAMNAMVTSMMKYTDEIDEAVKRVKEMKQSVSSYNTIDNNRVLDKIWTKENNKGKYLSVYVISAPRVYKDTKGKIKTYATEKIAKVNPANNGVTGSWT